MVKRMKFLQKSKLLLVVLITASNFLIISSVNAEDLRNVLVLNSYHRGFEGSDAIMEGIEEQFDSNYPATLYFEYFDTKRYEPNDVFPHMKDWLDWKYKKVKLDLIISSDNCSLDFLRLYRNQLFGKVPVVFVGINKFEDWMIKGLEPVTGLVESYDKESTIDIALKFHPWAKELLIVQNSLVDSWQDFSWIISHYEKRIKISSVDVTQMTVDKFFQEFSKTDKNSIVLLPWSLSDVNGKEYSKEQISAIFKMHPGPIYTNGFSWIGKGPIGGSVNSGTYHGKITAEMAIRILKGENPIRFRL